MNYAIRPYWDTNLAVVLTLGDVSKQSLAGLAFKGVYTVTGAPSAVANHWIPGATVENAIDGTMYINQGSTAAPVWVIMDTGEAFTLPDTVPDTTTTTGTSLAFVLSALTTGVGQIITAAAATTATIYSAFANALTTGIVYLAKTGSAMTTGRFFSANNGTTEVFGVGVNGHIISTVSGSAPTCAITTAQGITAASLAVGSSDTSGTISTVGTQNNTADSTFTLTFGKTYTTTPKSVILSAANSAGAVGSSLPYVVSKTATAIVFGITKSAAAAATPSWTYLIVA